MCHEIHSKNVELQFVFVFDQITQNIFYGNLDFVEVFSNFSLEIWFFWTYMESNAAVTLHFEDLVVTNYSFLKDMCFW